MHTYSSRGYQQRNSDHDAAINMYVNHASDISAVARNELIPDKIFDYGLVNCPPGTQGCFYYPHRQCINGKSRITYSITGCLGNPDLCDRKELEVKKLNGTTRCCYHLGCNFDMYNFLYNLPRGIAQYDSDDKDCGPGAAPEKIIAPTEIQGSSAGTASSLGSTAGSTATLKGSETVTTNTMSSASVGGTSSTTISSTVGDASTTKLDIGDEKE
ncbi:hypothetical protein Y032_0124g1225 [Ancylostoma ceylanicum]|uniref:Uncharacterized protein n=1 Tax=Ancylostoma ceylanicum TaxID=53326 RepID=A0A016T937_9BILA|nr:hypothetical protein Y032_0124g1225 [Ancylostoma ceylanicum]